MDLESAPAVPSPVCAATLRVHAFQRFGDVEARCRDCGLVMPESAVVRDGIGARHCLACGWWSGEEDCAGRAPRCVWCKATFDE